MRFITPSEIRWFAIVALSWFSLLSIAAVLNLTPASAWLRVGAVYVYDTQAGQQPRMRVAREIIRPNRAEWIATVQRRESHGGYSAYCTATGSADYREDDAVPDDLRLSWWTFPVRCDLPPGVYRVITLWRIAPPGFPPKEVRSKSNDFRVYP